MMSMGDAAACAGAASPAGGSGGGDLLPSSSSPAGGSGNGDLLPSSSQFFSAADGLASTRASGAGATPPDTPSSRSTVRERLRQLAAAGLDVSNSPTRRSQHSSQHGSQPSAEHSGAAAQALDVFAAMAPPAPAPVQAQEQQEQEQGQPCERQPPPQAAAGHEAHDAHDAHGMLALAGQPLAPELAQPRQLPHVPPLNLQQMPQLLLQQHLQQQEQQFQQQLQQYQLQQYQLQQLQQQQQFQQQLGALPFSQVLLASARETAAGDGQLLPSAASVAAAHVNGLYTAGAAAAAAAAAAASSPLGSAATGRSFARRSTDAQSVQLEQPLQKLMLHSDLSCAAFSPRPLGALAAQQLGRFQAENAELQERLVAAQTSLADTQLQLADSKAQLAAADKANAGLLEQLEQLSVKARAQESQLDSAHKQLDVRQQELRAQGEALADAQRSAQQLQQRVDDLSDEVSGTKREAEAVNKQMLVEAGDAKRWADESFGLRRELGQLAAELERARAELASCKEQLRQAQADSGRRAVHLEGQAADLSQQLTLVKDRASVLEAHNARLSQQLAAADGEHAQLQAELASAQSLRQELAATCEQLRQQQLDANRRAVQLQAEAADASQQLMALRAQNEHLSQRLSTEQHSNAALRADLESSWQSLRSTSRAAQEAKEQQQLLAQQLHNAQQLQQGLWGEPSSSRLAVLPAGSGPDSLKHSTAGLWPEGSKAAGLHDALHAREPVRSGSPGVAAWAVQPQHTPAWASPGREASAALRADSGAGSASGAGAGQAQQHALQGRVQPLDALPWFSGGPGLRTSQQSSSSTAPSRPGGGTNTSLAAERSSMLGHAGPEASCWPHLQQQQQLVPQPAAPSACSSPRPAFDSPPRPGTTGDSHGVAAGAPGCGAPSAADVKARMAATKQLEEQLLALCQERDELNRELAKLPLGAGRTLRERERKAAIEARLEELGVAISRSRMQVKRLTSDIDMRR